MIFSLNTDDYNSYCGTKKTNQNLDYGEFPLIRKINSILFTSET